MANMEKFQSYPLACSGGLDTSQNSLSLSMNSPGAATALVNFEPSLYGGYRRISGYQPLEATNPEVDPGNAEGRILGVFIYNSKIFTARKQQSGNTYNFYEWDPLSAWIAKSTGLTLNVTGVTKIRDDTFNFNAKPSVIFVDGVNNATIHDGTNWGQISSTGTGTDYANAGGDQALDAPAYVTVFKNHVFVSGDASHPHLVAHSAPSNECDWTAASGAGQIVVGFPVVQIKPFRDELYVFGTTQIKKIVVLNTDFVLQDVTKNIGCLASDSVVEVDSDLQFLSQDGFRTIAGTEKIGDVNMAILSKSIQQDVTDFIHSSDLPSVNSVVVRRKSQVRHFFSNTLIGPGKNEGMLGGLRSSSDGTYWEWSRLRGIRTTCTTSGYINAEEYVLHGDMDGVVYRQESGSSFNGDNIVAIYRTPYLDFGDVFIRKTLHKIFVFVKPEGDLQLTAQISYDWDDNDVLDPSPYILGLNVIGDLYGEGEYGHAHYAATPRVVSMKNIEGGGMSNRITFSTNDTNPSYSIQGISYEYAVNGRK